MSCRESHHWHDIFRGLACRKTRSREWPRSHLGRSRGLMQPRSCMVTKSVSQEKSATIKARQGSHQGAVSGSAWCHEVECTSKRVCQLGSTSLPMA